MNTTEQKFYALLTSIEDKLELQKPTKTITKKPVKKPVKRKKA